MNSIEISIKIIWIPDDNLAIFRESSVYKAIPEYNTMQKQKLKKKLYQWNKY